MKTIPYLFAGLLLAVTLSADEARNPQSAADLAQQANAKLQEAASPEDYRSAAALLERAVQLDPENMDNQQTLGWVYLEKLHEPHAAYPHLKKLAKHRPNDVNARKLFGMACSQTGHPARAVEEFRAASELKPDDVWIRTSLARALAHDGKWKEAEAIYQDVLQKDPNNTDALLGEAELQAWRGSNERPLRTLDQLLQSNPDNADALVLRGDIHRWNWDLSDARQDYRGALAVETNNTLARTGIDKADEMGASWLGVTGYQFKDTTDFRREYLEADGRVHLDEHVYLLGDVAGWRFTNPGFSHLDREDAAAGFEFDFARWLQITAEGTGFSYIQTNRRAFWGGKIMAKISPVTGTDLYLSGAYDQPFISSIATVESAMRQHSVGAGIDTKLIGRFSFQTDAQGAKLSDGNYWWEVKPQLSFKLFNVPATYIRAQYDYLSYSRFDPNYWTPRDWHTLGPVLDTRIPICKGVYLTADAKAPFVFSQSEFGFQVEGGPEIDLCKHVQAKGTYYYSTIPGDRGAWSGNGWMAYIRILF